MRCKLTFEIFELGLIAVQNDISNFRAWPYCRAPVYLFGDMLLLLGKGLIFEGVKTIDVVFGGVVVFGEIIARDQFQRATPNTDNVSDS